MLEYMLMMVISFMVNATLILCGYYIFLSCINFGISADLGLVPLRALVNGPLTQLPYAIIKAIGGVLLGVLKVILSFLDIPIIILWEILFPLKWISKKAPKLSKLL